MSKKYEMIPEGTLFRLKALRYFSDVKAGDIGGLIEKEDNLEHYGACWVYDNARVYGDAEVCGSAKISENAKVFGTASVYGPAKVAGHAMVYGDSAVFDTGHVHGHAQVYGNAKILGEVCDEAEVYDNSKVCFNAKICENARVCGNAKIHGGVVVNSTMKIRFGELERLSVIDLLRCSLGVHPAKGIVRLFKRVWRNLKSEHDYEFKYPAEGLVECVDYDPDPKVSCGRGLHFSTGEFWPLKKGYKYLVADIHVDDIICVLEGKVRVKKATIIDVIDYI